MNALQRFWNGETNIAFFRWRMVTYVLSGLLMLASIGGLAVKGLNFGLDFTGGTLVEASYDDAVDLEEIRARLASADFADATVQHIGTAREVSVRIATREGVSNEQLGHQILAALAGEKKDPVELKRIDFVGSQVGDELAEQGTMAALVTVIAVLIYVAFRFEWKLAVGSIIGTVHDAVLVLGAFAIFQWNFDLTALAAVMAILGYSLNDKVVIFDRVRENFRKPHARTANLIDLMDQSINQTLARTTMTTGLTFIVCLALFLYGGPSIHEFSLALLIGVFSAIYSSVYISSCFALDIGLNREDLMPPVVEKEGADLDAMP